MKREIGYYWVNLNGHWYVAFYTGKNWAIAGYFTPFETYEFQEIIEHRIVAPNENYPEKEF